MSELENTIEQLIARKRRIQQESKYKINGNSSKTVDNTISPTVNLENATSKRAEMISHLRLAKTAHVAWMSNVQILIQLGNISAAKASTPINYTTCDFGKWYYGAGQVLTPFKEYRDIEPVHEQVHSTYLEIFSMYNQRLEGSFFTSVKKLEKERKEKAVKLEVILKEYSKLLFDLLIALEMKIKRMSDMEINAL